MEDQAANNTSEPALPSAPQPRRWRRWALLAALALLVGAGVILGWPHLQHRPTATALDGELTVSLIRPSKGGFNSFRVDEPGALPARAGDRMHLQVRYNQPAHTYLVWLDAKGDVVPLYPWNMDTIEIKDADAAPDPSCRAASFLLSPMTLGASWPFDKHRGLETVLVLARRTPLDKPVKLGSLFGSLAPVPLRAPGELAILGLDRGTPGISRKLELQRGDVAEARRIDAPLEEILEKLREHFEMVRAVRFAHEGE